MRLIDLDDLLKFPIRMENYDTENGNEHFVLGIESVLEYAEHLPTVDAVPVVRCKDCMRRGTTDCPMLEVFNSYPFYEPEDDTFCSYGVACHTMKTVSQMMNEPKIKTHFAKIVVCGTEQNPYYNILYYDPSDKEYHLGYGSYCISFVRQWLAEEFEITPGMNESVVHGRWGNYDPYLDGYPCSRCKLSHRCRTPYCSQCGARMDGGNENE